MKWRFTVRSTPRLHSFEISSTASFSKLAERHRIRRRMQNGVKSKVESADQPADWAAGAVFGAFDFGPDLNRPDDAEYKPPNRYEARRIWSAKMAVSLVAHRTAGEISGDESPERSVSWLLGGYIRQCSETL
jgi:hypothetical protein